MTGKLDLETAVKDWFIEYEYFNYSTLACQEGEMCGHYTQVVWATSERIGCETTFCETLELINDTDMHLLVCNYQPPGNYRGVKPYIEGPPCSMCPDGYFCRNKLCDSTADVTETTVPPTAPELETATILTASPDLQSIETVSPAGSEPPTMDSEDTTPDSESDTEALQTATDGIDESLMTATWSLVNLIPSSTSPETETEKSTGTERPTSADVLITTQASLVKTERPATTLTTTKTPSIPTPPSVPKPPSIPKPPSVSKPRPEHKPDIMHKPPSDPKSRFVTKPPFITKPQFFPKPPHVPIKRPISKKPARHRLMAYSEIIQRRSNSFQSTAGKEASISVCLPCLGCKQISQPEEIKAALHDLTLRYPYVPCFGSLPRWQRHSKCSWCGHTRNNALRNTRPYWLYSS
ncbi:peptidase inhibitor 16 isoform X2 [Erythrolamprus reginae]